MLIKLRMRSKMPDDLVDALQLRVSLKNLKLTNKSFMKLISRCPPPCDTPTTNPPPQITPAPTTTTWSKKKIKLKF
jgi:hypothetical protein